MGKTLKNIVASISRIGISLFAGEKANATLISSFSELLEPGYTTQGIYNYPNFDFKVNNQNPLLNYKFGFLNPNGYVIGFLDSRDYEGAQKYLSGSYNGDPNVPGYENVLGVGERPYNLIVVEDTNQNNIIGDLKGENFTVDYGDRSWLTADIEFNGVAGAISEMPDYTAGRTLVVPAFNLIPACFCFNFNTALDFPPKLLPRLGRLGIFNLIFPDLVAK